MNKIFSMLGLCMKAGKLAYGSDMVYEKVKYKQVSLLIIAEDSSENTKEKFRKIASQNNIELHVFGTIDELSLRIGKNNKAILGIMDKNFAEKISKLFEELKGANC